MTRLTRRRGMALVLVLGLLTITLAASYALLRTQSYDRKIMLNHERRGDARSNAQVGIATALRRMYDGTWGGADSNFTVDLGGPGTNSFTATYATGDSSISSGSAEAWRIPYRVTITVVGTAADPQDTNSKTTHQIQVIAEFVRRKLNTNRIAPSDLEQHSLYQHGTGATQLSFPFRVNGNFYTQGQIQFNNNYPSPKNSAAYVKYFEDLKALQTAGVMDMLPFSGTICTPLSVQGTTNDFTLTLQNRLSTASQDVAVDTTVAVPVSTTVTNYRLYPGGKLYNASALPTSYNIANILEGPDVVTSGTYVPDAVTNPLGLRTLSNKNAGFRNNTSLTGTLEGFGSTSNSNVCIAGDNITITPVNLPALSGDATTYQLAAVRTAANVWILGDGTNRNLNGLFSAGSTFGAADGLAGCTVNFNGTGTGATVRIGARLLWNRGNTYWSDALTAFNAVTANPKYFPKWLADNRSSDSFFLEQRLVFNPPPAGIKYFVPDWSQPIFVAHDSDGGLIWDIVRWVEN